MHVPEEDLTKYRALKRISEQFDRLGNSLSNIGSYADANFCYAMSAQYLSSAQILRVPGNQEAAAQKLEGDFNPCTVKCGAPEPCFGCDSSDYVDP